MMNKIIIFDNGGRTRDRYTIIHTETGDVFGAGEDLFLPNGVTFHGNCAAHRLPLYGSGWRQQPPTKKAIQSEVENYVNNARLNKDWIGQEAQPDVLPEPVLAFIRQRWGQPA